MEKKMIYEIAVKFVSQYMQELHDICADYPFDIRLQDVTVRRSITFGEYYKGDFTYDCDEDFVSISCNEDGLYQDYVIFCKKRYRYDEIANDKVGDGVKLFILGFATFLSQSGGGLKSKIRERIAYVNRLTFFEI